MGAAPPIAPPAIKHAAHPGLKLAGLEHCLEFLLLESHLCGHHLCADSACRLPQSSGRGGGDGGRQATPSVRRPGGHGRGELAGRWGGQALACTRRRGRACQMRASPARRSCGICSLVSTQAAGLLTREGRPLEASHGRHSVADGGRSGWGALTVQSAGNRRKCAHSRQAGVRRSTGTPLQKQLDWRL